MALSRRAFLTRLGCACVGAMVPASVGYAWAIEPRWLHVYRREVRIPGLPPTFEGLRLAQLTDIHHGPFLGVPRIQHAVALTNFLQPDVIALTGDYVHRSPRYIAPCQRALAGLQAPLGVYGVLGNHDHWEDAALTREEMARAGIMEITNMGVPLERNGQAIWIAGVGDLWEDEQRLEQALARVPPDGCVILLSHNPDYNEQMEDRRVKLMLAGHTHGGQVNLPLLGAPLVPSRFGRKYVADLVQDGWKQVYVSRGVGCITPPLRFRCPPEVTLLTLRPAPA